MTNEEQQDTIQELSSWDFPDTVSIPDGYDRKQVPANTTKNMEVLMNKLNEVIQVINTSNKVKQG